MFWPTGALPWTNSLFLMLELSFKIHLNPSVYIFGLVEADNHETPWNKCYMSIQFDKILSKKKMYVILKKKSTLLSVISLFGRHFSAQFSVGVWSCFCGETVWHIYDSQFKQARELLSMVNCRMEWKSFLQKRVRLSSVLQVWTKASLNRPPHLISPAWRLVGYRNQCLR